MKGIKRIIGVACLVGLVLSEQAHAQSGYADDALRFSQFQSTGSARILGLGGAQTSLGGDISNIHMNPAGLGFFRRSEFSITAGAGSWNTETTFLQQPQEERRGIFNVPNLSVVISRPREGFTDSGFRGGTFGISINRVANFNKRFGYFSDIEGNSSIIDFFLADAQGIPENQIENRGLTGAAYQSFLINPIAFDNQGNPINNPNQYFSFVGGLPFQDEFVEQEGGITQTTFSYGANFGNKLFIGAGLGISSVNYLRTATFNEEFFGEPLNNMSIQENLRINGFGVNLNAGIIYKPIDQVNLGFNFQSPTWYRLNEEYDGRIVAFYDNFFFEDEGIRLNREEGLTPFVISTFNLNTPMRLSAGGTFFVGKNGFITADVDYIDYSMNRLNSRDFNPSLDNQQINTLFGQAINFRVGGEFRYDIFRFRGGYGLYGDPFVNDDFDRTQQQFTGGVGVRLSKFYVDFAFISNNFRDLYTSYSLIDGGQELGAVAEVRNVINQGVLTLGFNF